MSKSYENYKAAQLCRFGACKVVATHRYETSRRLSHCIKHAISKMIPSPPEERCVSNGCPLIAIYKYDSSILYTHCYYHSYDGQRCEPVVCGICGTVATYKCSISGMLYCRADHTPTSFNIKIDHCRADVHTCAKIDINHCKNTKHKCVVKNCKSMAGHYVYNIYKTHCYRHSTGDYIAYAESQESKAIIPPVEINRVVEPVSIIPVAIMPVDLVFIKPVPIENIDIEPINIENIDIEPTDIEPTDIDLAKNKQFNPDDLFI